MRKNAKAQPENQEVVEGTGTQAVCLLHRRGALQICWGQSLRPEEVTMSKLTDPSWPEALGDDVFPSTQRGAECWCGLAEPPLPPCLIGCGLLSLTG